jgi:DNA-binding XRE family transcriptional regulator
MKTTDEFEETLRVLANDVAVAMARELYADDPEALARLDVLLFWADRVRKARAELEATQAQLAMTADVKAVLH